MALNAAEIAELSRAARAESDRWHREELPKERAKLLAAAWVPREAILDNIVSEDELRSLGFKRNPDTGIWERRDLAPGFV